MLGYGRKDRRLWLEVLSVGLASPHLHVGRHWRTVRRARHSISVAWRGGFEGRMCLRGRFSSWPPCWVIRLRGELAMCRGALSPAHGIASPMDPEPRQF